MAGTAPCDDMSGSTGRLMIVVGVAHLLRRLEEGPGQRMLGFFGVRAHRKVNDQGFQAPVTMAGVSILI